MKKLFIVASLAFAVSFAVAEVVTLKVEVDFKEIDKMSFDVSKGRDALAVVVYNYCLKPPKKVQNALKKSNGLDIELSIGFYNPNETINLYSLSGKQFLSSIARCEFDKAKGYSLSKMNGYNVVRPDLGREVILQGISESMEENGAWFELEKVAQEQAEQKSQKDKK